VEIFLKNKIENTNNLCTNS